MRNRSNTARRAVLGVAIAGVAHAQPAAPIAVDTVLCQRVDDRFGGEHRSYLSVVRSPDHHTATNADRSLSLVEGDDSLRVVAASGAKSQRKIYNKRDRGFSCGGGLLLGETILAFGRDCTEFTTKPFLANANTGKFIAPLVDKDFLANGETQYDAVQLDRQAWAVAVFDHEATHGTQLGRVYVIDVTTGEVKATVQGAKPASAVVHEGKKTRSLDAIAACKP